MKKFDVGALFETRLFWQLPGYSGYRSLAAELDAIRDGKKAMSMLSAFRDWVDSDNFRELHAAAHARDLTVVIDPDRRPGFPAGQQHVRLFILRHDDLWRVPAYRTMWDSFHAGDGWNAALEAQQGMLLGYSARQREAWLAQQRWKHVAWKGVVHYALLTKSQRAEVVALGNKAFRDPTGLTFYTCGFGLRQDAVSRVPKGLTVARFELLAAFGWKIVGEPGKSKRPRHVSSGVVTPRLAPQINRELRSKIEFLDRRGWS